ncbi:hypothetical protein WMY93_009884 [Mugilogobius chulae]|uniref:DDE Tnp4 domain-containing protein n=1 Tax=Mugilogobius chulae TaxID=88201 RepID=A0AAW0P5V8_9GOBI
MEDQGMDQVELVGWVYLIHRVRQRRRARRRIWVHEILHRRTELGEFHHLLQDEDRFQRFLTTGDSYRTIASSFRVGVSMVCTIVPDVVTAIWDCLVEEFMAVREGTLHLPPDQSLPGADHRGPQPHVFVADEAFALQQNLMRPYSGRGGLAPGERVFNYRLSRARLAVEDAFGIWSSQWRMFRRELEVHPDVAAKCAKTTCVLHNFMRATVVEPAPGPGAAARVLEPLPDVGRMGANNASQEATRVREVFKAHFCGEGAVAWQPAQ